MRARPFFLVALALTLAGLAAYVAVPPLLARQHRAAAARAEAVLRRLPPLAGAAEVRGRECPGGAEFRCLRVDREVDAVAAEVAAALRTASGREPTRDCHDLFVRTRGAERIPTRDCLLRVPTGRGHGLLVSVGTHVARGADGDLRARGTDVHVGAY